MVKVQQTACFLMLVTLGVCVEGARYARPMDKKTTKYPNPNGKGKFVLSIECRGGIHYNFNHPVVFMKAQKPQL